MAEMVRKQIYIEERHERLLKRISKARGVSEAELIRQAIERETIGGKAPSSGTRSGGLGRDPPLCERPKISSFQWPALPVEPSGRL